VLSIVSIYDDVVKDTANSDQNGAITYDMFTRMSKRAELRLLDWLSGDVSNERPPAPYLTQKNKDWLSPFIVKLPAQVVNGVIQRPADYYQYENFYRLGTKVNADCEDDDIQPTECNTPIEILDGQQFYERCNTYIEELKPSLNVPICKLLGNTFEVLPKDLGSVCLEYIRYPNYGSIIPKIDVIYNEEVPDIVTNYEWNENSRELLIWFICDTFANHTREQALKQFNAASNPKQ
jgi:hypothetical protein